MTITLPVVKQVSSAGAVSIRDATGKYVCLVGTKRWYSDAADELVKLINGDKDA